MKITNIRPSLGRGSVFLMAALLFCGCASHNALPLEAASAKPIAPLPTVEKPEAAAPAPAPAEKSLAAPGREPAAPRSGKSYVVKGRRYHILSSAEGYEQKGLATWYGPGFHGRKTASGEPFDMNKLTAAHKTLPLGCRVEVISEETGRSVVVRINDRGPFGGDHHLIDLSKAAARKIGHQGTGRVKVRALKP